MSIDLDRAKRLAERVMVLTPGRTAGRMIDGVDLVIDGRPAGRMAPRWLDGLQKQGFDPDQHGPVEFAVLLDDRVREVRDDIREALYEALALVARGSHPERVRVEAHAGNDLTTEVVSGHPLIGMAIGALQDEPITVAEGPAWLPPYLPGEEPRRRKRSRRAGSSGG
jgi:hypothetical protein